MVLSCVASIVVLFAVRRLVMRWMAWRRWERGRVYREFVLVQESSRSVRSVRMKVYVWPGQGWCRVEDAAAYCAANSVDAADARVFTASSDSHAAALARNVFIPSGVAA